jgi:hypothetical protein
MTSIRVENLTARPCPECGDIRRYARAMPGPVAAALDMAQTTLDELERRCCDGGRSPRLAALAAKLTEIQQSTEQPGGVEPEAVSASLQEAGAMVGALQVACCAPNRLPLYTSLLEQLNVVQRHLAPTH